MARIAVTDGMANDAVLMLQDAGHQVEMIHGTIKKGSSSEDQGESLD